MTHTATMSGHAGSKNWSPARLCFYVIAFSALLRVILATTTGFTIDETYMVVAARTPALGYIDHPPLTMWLAWASTQIFGSEAPIVIRLPALILFVGTSGLIWRLTQRLFGDWAGFYAVATLSTTLIFGLYEGSFIVTDGPMLFALALGINGLVDALFFSDDRTNWWAWIIAGIGLGLALLSKYTAVLALPGLGLFFLTQSQYRKWLAHPAPYLALAIAALLVLPPVIWNLDHSGGSFLFQGTRGFLSTNIEWARFLRFTIILALVFFPPIWLGLIVAFFDGLRRGPRDPKRWLLTLLALAPIMFFPLNWLIGAQGERGLHWAAPGYLLVFPLLGALMAHWATRWPRMINGTLGTLGVIFTALILYVTTDQLTDWTHTMPSVMGKKLSVKSDIEDWHQLPEVLAALGFNDPDRYYIIGAAWEDCARIGVVLGPDFPVFSFENAPIDTAFSPDPAILEGRQAILLGIHESTDDLRQRLDGYFATFTSVGPVPLTYGNARIVFAEMIVASDPIKPIR